MRRQPFLQRLGDLVSVQVTVTVTGSADLHGGSAGKLGLDIQGNLTAMKTAVLDKNLVGSHARHNHSGKIEPGNIALQRLRIALWGAIFAFHAYTGGSQKIKVGMVPRQG